MTKQKSQKEMKASLINELSKQYKQKYGDKINILQDRLYQTLDVNKNLEKELHRLKNENFELQDKINKYEDWIQRLQEWCNLPDDERTKAIAEYNKQFNEFEFTKEIENNLFKMFVPYFKMMSL